MFVGLRQNLTFFLWATCCLICIFALAACDDDSDNDDNDDNNASTDVPPDNPDPYTGPDDDDDDEPFLGFDEAQEMLLRRWAPVFIQRLPAQEPLYNPRADRIGQLSLSSYDTDWEYRVNVDTATRVVYATARLARLGLTTHVQLLYLWFYPERPVDVTPEQNASLYWLEWLWSGDVDAKVLRVTLDVEAVEPLLYETVNLGGDGYALFVDKRVEQELIAEFEASGDPFPGVARPDGPLQRMVTVMPGNIDGATRRPTLALADGYDFGFHRVVDAWTSYEQYYFDDEIKNGLIYADADWFIFDPRTLERTDYILRPYEELSRLPPAGSLQPVGIFDRWGNIWNGYTPPARFFLRYDIPLFPGTPRELDRVMVLNNAFAFMDAATLLEALIYLPASLF